MNWIWFFPQNQVSFLSTCSGHVWHVRPTHLPLLWNPAPISLQGAISSIGINYVFLIRAANHRTQTQEWAQDPVKPITVDSDQDSSQSEFSLGIFLRGWSPFFSNCKAVRIGHLGGKKQQAERKRRKKQQEKEGAKVQRIFESLKYLCHLCPVIVISLILAFLRPGYLACAEL